MTIGYAGISAEQFFTRLREAGVHRLIDVRLSNQSQLAGFTKRNDLRYFVRQICGAEYTHVLQLAPSSDLFAYIKKNPDDWEGYEQRFINLLTNRQIERVMPRVMFDEACLLCSEASPRYCHRRLVGEYLQSHWGRVELIHL
jgi:uncharacterized protein (DUF488 family)